LGLNWKPFLLLNTFHEHQICHNNPCSEAFQDYWCIQNHQKYIDNQIFSLQMLFYEVSEIITKGNYQLVEEQPIVGVLKHTEKEYSTKMVVRAYSNFLFAANFMNNWKCQIEKNYFYLYSCWCRFVCFDKTNVSFWNTSLLFWRRLSWCTHRNKKAKWQKNEACCVIIHCWKEDVRYVWFWC